jgi:hypothetical protein
VTSRPPSIVDEAADGSFIVFAAASMKKTGDGKCCEALYLARWSSYRDGERQRRTE